MDSVTEGSKKGLFERFGSNVFLLVMFLLPIFFVASQAIPFQFGKGFFLVLSVFLLVFFFLVNVLKKGFVTIPLSLTLLGLCAVFLSYVISAASGAHKVVSFFGQGFELDTAFLTLVLLLLAILPTLMFKSKPALFNIYIVLLASFFVVVLFNLVRFIAPNSLSFGIFTGSVANLVGTWNDLGTYAGFMTILSLISLGALQAKELWRTILNVVLFLSLVFLAIVNFNTLWIIVGSFALIVFLYSLSYAKHRGILGSALERIKKVSWAPIIVLVVALIFMFDATINKDASGNKLPGPISSFISTKLNIVQLEARPSWSTTLSIVKATLKENPILGASPNQFIKQWLINKPISVNESIFWNVDFSASIGTVPTTIITLGTLGLLSWLVFFGFFIFEGQRAVRSLHGDVFSHYLVFSSFVGAIYFWLVAILYTPTHVVYALAYLFTGIFVTTLILEGIVKEKQINFSETAGKSFIGSLIVILLLIGTVTGIYLSGKRFTAFAMFNNAIAAYRENADLDQVENKVKQTILIEENDLFYRTFSDIYLTRLNILAQTQPKQEEMADLGTKFRQYLEFAIGSAREAEKQNPDNYLNQLQLAKVFEVVVPVKGVEGAYEQAVAAYDKAVALNPTSPAIMLARARLEVINANNLEGREYIKKALALKSNYTDAIFLLTQIEVSEGNTKKAIEAVISASLLDPTNPVIFFQLGLLYYNEANYSKAIEAFSQATRLEPQYANAKYFLGLSYDKLGRNLDAVKQFEELQITNPDNAEVKFILTNLKAGRSAFAEVAPPLDNKPEKRGTLPIPEDTEAESTAN